jgi:catechol 2,3-dioxygenase-like lactoylglutathione lyase family enzyme
MNRASHFRALASCTALSLIVVLRGAAAAEWDHIHLTATDTLEAARWYAKHFGSEVTKVGPFDAVIYGKTTVKFKQGAPDFNGSVGSTVDHIGFSVPDVAAKIKELEQAGVKVVARPRYSEKGGFYYAFVEDPWGTKIEVIGDPDLLGFHHVHLKVRHRDAAAKWFADTFGGKVTHFKDLPQLPAIRYDDMWLVISGTDADVAPNDGRAVDHIGWKVDDLDAVVERLKAQKLKFPVEPTRSGNVKLAFVESPSGVKIEIQQVLDD